MWKFALYVCFYSSFSPLSSCLPFLVPHFLTFSLPFFLMQKAAEEVVTQNLFGKPIFDPLKGPYWVFVELLNCLVAYEITDCVSVNNAYITEFFKALFSWWLSLFLPLHLTAGELASSENMGFFFFLFLYVPSE